MEENITEKEHDPSAVVISTDSLPTYEEVLEWDYNPPLEWDLNKQRQGGPQSDPGAAIRTKLTCVGCKTEVDDLYTCKKGYWKCDQRHVNLCFECAKKDCCPLCPGRWPMRPEGKLKGPKKQ